ncbi:MAG: HAMP domain-containing protein [Symploca sp. SIO2G7]|nr:HAMP domain-containing protein [Symploca sp. SIO2G7]
MSDQSKNLLNLRRRFLGSIGFNSLSIQSKLQGFILLVSLGSVVMVSLIAWYQGRATLTERVTEQLTGIRAARADQFEAFFESLYEQVRRLATEQDTIEAIVDFNKSFRQLDRSFIDPEWDDSLNTYYSEEFFPRLSENTGEEELRYGIYRPDGQAARYLQYYYISENPNPVGEKEKLLDPGDGSEYTRFHTKYHSLFREIIDNFGYYDLFLVNHRTGDIVYSVFKETDYGTNLLSGPYAQSGLADVVKAVLDNPTPGSIQFVDFKSYRPSYEAPAAFLATPIYSGVNMIGVLAVQVPTERINDIMSVDNKWEESGLGKTGEVYVVGSDQLMRSNSRFLTEAPKEYKRDVKGQGTPEEKLVLMENLGTTISLQPVTSQTAQAAIGGQKGIKIIENYRSAQVLSSYAPLDLKDVNWGIVAEIETAEVYRPLYILQMTLLIAAVIFLLVSALIAGLVSRLFTRPLYRLTEGAKTIEAGDLDTEIALQSKDEFGELAEAFQGIAHRFRQTRQELESQQQENDLLLRNFLPGAIADRLKKGETLIADRLNKITLLYAHVAGVANLSKEIPPSAITELLTKLFDEFDILAEKHGMERQRTIGADYMAVCGLTQTRLDHTQRTIKFALEILDKIQNKDFGQQAILGLQIGVHVGSVNAGIVGSQTFGYDIWGEDVYVSRRLHLQADLNQIVVTRPVYERLGDFYTFIEYPSMNVESLGEIAIWSLMTSKKMVLSQVELVESSFAKVKPIADKAGELFYQRLFEQNPDLRHLFSGDMVEQQRKLMSTLAIAVEGLRRPENIIPAVQELGRRHAGYGVMEEHYAVVGEALLWTLKQGLGDEFTLPVRRAWEEAFTYLSRIMKEAAAELDRQKVGV